MTDANLGFSEKLSHHQIFLQMTSNSSNSRARFNHAQICCSHTDNQILLQCGRSEKPLNPCIVTLLHRDQDQ